MKVFIYALCDPDTKEIRYIGKSGDLKRRLYLHVWTAKTRAVTHKDRWVKSLLDQGKTPILEVLEECAEETWCAREKYWIARLENLTNILEGGECGGGMKGRKLSAEAKAKIGAAHRGVLRGPMSARQKLKISATAKKTLALPEVKTRHSAGLMGNQNAACFTPNKVTDAVKRYEAGASIPEIGKHFNVTHSTILNWFKRVGKQTDETPHFRPVVHTAGAKEKIAASKRGRTRKPFSPEWRAKIAASVKAARAAKANVGVVSF